MQITDEVKKALNAAGVPGRTFQKWPPVMTVSDIDPADPPFAAHRGLPAKVPDDLRQSALLGKSAKSPRAPQSELNQRVIAQTSNGG